MERRGGFWGGVIYPFRGACHCAMRSWSICANTQDGRTKYPSVQGKITISIGVGSPVPQTYKPETYHKVAHAGHDHQSTVGGEASGATLKPHKNSGQ
jgi:hypothetical protein